jgi:hypothetical protein
LDPPSGTPSISRSGPLPLNFLIIYSRINRPNLIFV